jgi:hypothetical protein
MHFWHTLGFLLLLTETIKYESVVKKLASYLKQIEVSNVTISGFSSSNTDVVNKGCLVTG